MNNPNATTNASAISVTEHVPINPINPPTFQCANKFNYQKGTINIPVNT